MGPTEPAAANDPLGAQLAEVRAAPARYHRVDAAIADGYVSTVECVELPSGAPMGIHFINPGLEMDPAIDPTRPELLLYVPTKNGRLRLVGVEYFKADADQNLVTDADRPALFGRGFDGPMLGHALGVPIHFDLHAWIWKNNRDGMFAEFNPSVSCSP
ncbi:hypothetical protein BH18CHL2_BH18CHL2_03450 [soil metagenome]